MNDSQELERTLEWATASMSPPESSMDPQTAVLRETWIAWGQLLEAAEAPKEPLTVRPAKSRPALRGFVGAAAVAAAVLAMVAATVWFAYTPWRSSSSIPRPSTIASAPPSAKRTDAPSLENPKDLPQQAAEPAVELAWNDTLDDEIDKAAEALVEVQRNWHVRAEPFDLVWSQLEQMGTELESGQL